MGEIIKEEVCMNIGLIDVDGHNFPNLALMKIARYHKNQGDTFDFQQRIFKQISYEEQN